MTRLILIGSIVALLSGYCFGGESTMHHESMEQILETIPFHTQESIEKRLKMFSPYFTLVSIDDVTNAFDESAVIERKHPQQKWGDAFSEKPEHKENDMHYWLVAHVLYWWCNVHKSIPVAKQIAFVKKQDSVLQQYWVDVVVHSKLKTSRPLAAECLRTDLWSSSVCGAFHDYTEWWGEPALLIDPEKCNEWPQGARNHLIEITLYSKDQEFKFKVSKGLYKDPERWIRDQVVKLIQSDRFPDPDMK